MERRTFIRFGSMACLAGVAVGTGLVGCAGARYVEGTIEGEFLRVPLGALTGSDGQPLKHIVVRNATLKWPVAVYREADGAYKALLMRCTHQGAQLKAGDGELTCAAHNSSFATDGTVTSGPAKQPLRTFPIRTEGEHLLISLKA